MLCILEDWKKFFKWENDIFIIDQVFVKLAGNQDSYKISDSDQTSHFGVICPWLLKKALVDIVQCIVRSFFIRSLWNLKITCSSILKIREATVAHFNITIQATANQKLVRTTLAQIYIPNCKPKTITENSCSTLHIYILNCKPKNSRDNFYQTTYLYPQGTTLAQFFISIFATATKKNSRDNSSRQHIFINNCKPKISRDNSCLLYISIATNLNWNSTRDNSCPATYLYLQLQTKKIVETTFARLHMYIHNCKPKTSRDNSYRILHIYIRNCNQKIVETTLPRLYIYIYNCLPKISRDNSCLLYISISTNANQKSSRDNSCMTLYLYPQLQTRN